VQSSSDDTIQAFDRESQSDVASMRLDMYTVSGVPLWCKWLTRRPLKAESTGSSPVSGID
jgi:hypothetical protein